MGAVLSFLALVYIGVVLPRILKSEATIGLLLSICRTATAHGIFIFTTATTMSP